MAQGYGYKAMKGGTWYGPFLHIGPIPKIMSGPLYYPYANY